MKRTERRRQRFPRTRGDRPVCQVSVRYLSVESGGLEPRSCSRPARDAAPTITPTPARRVPVVSSSNEKVPRCHSNPCMTVTPLSVGQSACVNVRADETGALSSVATVEHGETDTATTAGDSTRPSSRTARRTGLARSANGSTPNTRVFQSVRPHDGGSLEGRPCRLLRPALVAVSGADLDVLALVDQLARPTPKNPDGGPRFARLRGDRRETDATGRAERPSRRRG